MKPGREMDALVAEKVMGIVWDETRCPVCGWPFARNASEGCVPNNCSMRPRPARRADEPLPYSTDIAAAWQVIDHILGMRGEDGHFRKEAFIMNVNEDGRGDLVRWRSEHAAHIISAAALSAFGIDI